jgi:hypothetical protein
MSYVTASTYDLYEPAASEAQPSAGYLPRSAYLPIPFLAPALICGISWLLGGVPILTDIGFLLLAGVCIVFFINELVKFPRRFGTGGLLLFGGFLVWFCQDYMTHWLGHDFRTGDTLYSAATVAKSAFFHCVLGTSMAAGLLINRGTRVEKLLLSLPEPANPQLYLWTTIALCLVGFSAFAFFTSENFFTSLYRGMFAEWVGHPRWTEGRSGNYNYNWGGYVTQLLETGAVSGLFGLFYAVMVARSGFGRATGFLIWVFWTLYTFEDGRRGNLAKMVIPAVAIIFIKYQSSAVENQRRQSAAAYILGGAIGLALLLGVQFEGTFRTEGYSSADFQKVDLFANQGNTMFSEGLVGFQLVPDQQPFFANRIPGEGAIRAMPETLLYFLLHPIPRALWNTKPVDPSMVWYNQVVAGTNGYEGTTISQGLAGHWYFRYGFLGVIEGGLLVGWLMRIAERMLQDAQGRPTTILFSLSLSVWLFRTYRNFYFLDLWPMLLAFILFGVFVKLTRMFGGGEQTS